MAPHAVEEDFTIGLVKPFPKGILASPSLPLSSVQTLSQLLIRASTRAGGLTFYSSNEDGRESSRYVSYLQLLNDSKRKARFLTASPEISSSSVLLLHFNDQYETIQWFWAATLAGLLPAISTPFVNDESQRKKHLLHLQELLEQPAILTTDRLMPEFLDLPGLRLIDVEGLCREPSGGLTPIEFPKKSLNDPAVLMLTSGSTGNAKAVPLRHGQIVHALRGKSTHHGTMTGDVFLNWVGLDHVASLTEIHLQAMSLGSHQVHVPAGDLLRDPLLFIALLDSYKITYTFAPNFFLTKVRDALAEQKDSLIAADLSRLKALISGGESNVVATCDSLTQQLSRFGVGVEVIRPGFGMTETCAGSIYSKACPSYDLEHNLEFANLGTCVPGIQMRVMNGDSPAANCAVGELQVSGPIVFDGYYNNAAATAEAFSPDGWFITGDLAKIDENGSLILTGRTKDTIIVNGVKWSSTEIETAIEEEGIAGVISSFTVAFPIREANSPTEEIAVVYSPSFDPNDAVARFETSTAIAKTVSLIASRKPAHVIPLPSALLEKSSLGKISRAKVRAALEKGDYDSFIREDQRAIELHRRSFRREAATETERQVQQVVADLLNMPASDISMEASIFDLGIDSFNLILLKSKLQKAVDAPVDIPMSVLLTEPSVGTIAASIDTVLAQPVVYNPIVPLQPHGNKTPLFCIHPGSGDILVFIALAAHFPTRPVYAIRTRGYNPGERLFTSISETAETYAQSIRDIQPEGPYAISGYSLGSTLAYEVSKVLEGQGQEVRFCASIDYPPHIAHYVQTLNWIDVLLHIAFFLELIDEPTMVEITPHLHTLTRDGALEHILAIGDVERITSLAVDKEKLELISDIAENFRVNVETYEPIGKVEKLDVFVADPPTYAAKDRQDWRENKLGRWSDFSRQEAEYHDCPGIHAKMLNREHMADFARIFKAVMKKRGV